MIADKHEDKRNFVIPTERAFVVCATRNPIRPNGVVANFCAVFREEIPHQKPFGMTW
jgi:hypothetical protein